MSAGMYALAAWVLHAVGVGRRVHGTLPASQGQTPLPCCQQESYIWAVVLWDQCKGSCGLKTQGEA